MSTTLTFDLQENNAAKEPLSQKLFYTKLGPCISWESLGWQELKLILDWDTFFLSS